MTELIAARGIIYSIVCVMVASFSACARSNGNLALNNSGEIQKGKEFLIKERKVDAKYIRNICKRAKWIYDADDYRMKGGNYYGCDLFDRVRFLGDD